MNKEDVEWFKRRYKTHSIFIGFLLLMSIAATFTYIIYVEYKLAYLLVVFGGFLTGITAIATVMAQDVQYGKRLPKIFFHSYTDLRIMNKNTGAVTYPILLRNMGYVPGHNVLVILTVNPVNGNAEIMDSSWEDITGRNLSDSHVKIFQHREREVIYPFLETEGGVSIGELIIKYGRDNNYNIDVTARIYEEKGITERNCKFIKDGDRMEYDFRVNCDEDDKFSPYY